MARMAISVDVEATTAFDGTVCVFFWGEGAHVCIQIITGMM